MTKKQAIGKAFAGRHKINIPDRLRPYLLAVLSAVVMFLSVQIKQLWLLSFAGLWPLFYALVKCGVGTSEKQFARGAFVGFVFGFVYYSLCFVQLWRLMPGLNLAVGLYEALFPALFGLFTMVLTRRFSLCLVGMPVLWTACEVLRSLGPAGFTWYGVSGIQAYNLPLVQYASLFGSRFIDFLTALLVTASVLRCVDKNRYHQLICIAAVLLFMGIQIGGELFIRPLSSVDMTVKLVQANMDLYTKEDTEAVNTHIRLTRSGKRADLVLWPETTISTLGFAEIRVLSRLAKREGVLVVGANVPCEGGQTNSAVVFSPSGKQKGRYDKHRLVPFGEYVPLRNKISYPGFMPMRPDDVVKGKAQPGLLESGPFILGTAICSESSFSETARKQALAGANVLVLLSNDGWLKGGNAAEMHLRYAVLRAVENHRWYLRSASTGISAVVTPYGQIVNRTEENKRAVLTAPFGLERKKTLFTKTGDVFSVVCCCAALVCIIIGLVGFAGSRSDRKSPDG